MIRLPFEINHRKEYIRQFSRHIARQARQMNDILQQAKQQYPDATGIRNEGGMLVIERPVKESLPNPA